MSDRSDIFAGDNPFEIARRWLSEAEKTELNDPNAIALSTVDPDGLPNSRIVLLKEIRDDAFVFFTNYRSQKGQELESAGKAAFVMHWKSLRRQIRVRGRVEREPPENSDAYYASRNLQSRLGAWASRQSEPLESRAALMKRVAQVTTEHGVSPARPPFWGGYRIVPQEVEFWADGAFRLHDRFRWIYNSELSKWQIDRLYP